MKKILILLICNLLSLSLCVNGHTLQYNNVVDNSKFNGSFGNASDAFENTSETVLINSTRRINYTINNKIVNDYLVETGNELPYNYLNRITNKDKILRYKRSLAPIPVTSVNVTPATGSNYTSGTVQLSVQVLPSNATDKSVTWSTSNSAIAVVNSTGLVTGVGTGTATITATSNDNEEEFDACIITITAFVPVTGVTVSPASGTINAGSTLQLTTTVAPANASIKTVTWSPGNTSVATVSSGGLVTGVDGGTTTITVTTNSGSKTATCTITVNVPVTGLTLSPTSGTINVGSTLPLTATVSPANASNKTITWSSGNTSVAMVNSSGLVTGVGAGNVTITATTNDGAKTATCAITVNVPVTGVTLSPTSGTINAGGTLQLTATVSPANASNKTITWSSGNTSVATVSSSGLVTGVGGGNATITATTNDGAKIATCIITVNVPVTGVTLSPASGTINAGGALQLTATVIPTNATNKTVTWSTSNPSVAIVSLTGMVTGISDGTALITVTTNDGSITDICTVTVISTENAWLNNGDNIHYSFGNVGIGTTNPSKPLTVNGKILATRIKVVSSITADFVFDPKYNLMSISDLEIYFKQHKHLPGIPSSTEFNKNGQNLAKTDDLLLRKIEELTLYILQLQEEIEALKNQ